MEKILGKVNAFVWGIPALTLVIAVGLLLSVYAGFPQITLFGKALRAFFRQFGSRNPDGRSGYRALCTALAATVGTGNIVGVAGAIALGGPGAVFWMWVCGILGMGTKYAEATLAVRFRTRDVKGGYMGGPMYIIREGLGPKWHFLGTVYCFFGVVAAFGVGNATQVNAVLESLNGAVTALGGTLSRTRDLVIAIFLAILLMVLLSGGAKRIGAAAECVVPLAAGLYILLGAGLLIAFRQRIPGAFRMILQGAFCPQAVTGGLVGSFLTTIRIGASRGVFTNEAGMGTASIAHGGADVSSPAEQGLMGIMEVFWDTMVICTMTALVILCSGVPIPYGSDQTGLLTASAFEVAYGTWSHILLAAILGLLAFATIIGWGLYGARCAQFLFGEKVWRPFVLIQGAVTILSAFLKTQVLWTFSELVNGLMAIPNLIALAWLAPELRKLTKEYKCFVGSGAAPGGTYEDIHQCKPLRTVSYAEVSSSGSKGRGKWKEDLPFKYRPAGSEDTPGLL